MKIVKQKYESIVCIFMIFAIKIGSNPSATRTHIAIILFIKIFLVVGCKNAFQL